MPDYRIGKAPQPLRTCHCGCGATIPRIRLYARFATNACRLKHWRETLPEVPCACGCGRLIRKEPNGKKYFEYACRRRIIKKSACDDGSLPDDMATIAEARAVEPDKVGPALAEQWLRLAAIC